MNTADGRHLENHYDVICRGWSHFGEIWYTDADLHANDYESV